MNKKEGKALWHVSVQENVFISNFADADDEGLRCTVRRTLIARAM